MSQQLTVKQNQLSLAISKAGAVNQISFAKSVLTQTKIKSLTPEELSIGLGLLFTKITNLAGIKERISDNNKTDISELIETRFSGLSLEEIDYAFKLERYGEYDEKTQHFQLFNTDYVSAILYKYKNWLKKIRSEHKLPLSLTDEKPKLTKEEKNIITINGIISCFNQFKETYKIPIGYTYVYDFFYESGQLPKHSKKFKNTIYRKAVKRCYQESRTHLSKTIKNTIRLIKMGKNRPNTLCKEIVLETFFRKLIATNTSIEVAISKSANISSHNSPLQN